MHDLLILLWVHRTELGFKLGGSKFFVLKFKKIGISILEVDKVALLALIY